MALFDDEIQFLNAGNKLLEAPVGVMIERIAASIAQAQLKLDQIGVRVATLLSETQVSFNKHDGTTVSKSLLELGFVPPFYHFTETEVEVHMALSMKVEETLNVSGELDVGAAAGGAPTKMAVPFGLSVDAEYQRKYQFDSSASTRVKTKLMSIPAPTVFINTIQEHARTGGTVSTAPSGSSGQTATGGASAAGGDDSGSSTGGEGSSGAAGGASASGGGGPGGEEPGGSSASGASSGADDQGSGSGTPDPTPDGG